MNVINKLKLALVALCMVCFTSVANADLINAGGDVSSNVINFFAISNASDGNTTSSWVTDDPAPAGSGYFVDKPLPTPTLILDLQSDQDIRGAAFWAYATNVAANRNSVSEFSLRFATDAEGTANFGNSITYNPTFNPAHISQSIQQNYFFGQDISARYVEMTLTDNHYDGINPGGDRVGFSDLQFFTSFTGDTTLYNGSFEDVTFPANSFNSAGSGNVANWYNITNGQISNDPQNAGSQARSPGAAGVPNNFPDGQGIDGERVGHINAPGAGNTRSLVQDIDATFEAEMTYILDVAVGRRIDHDVLSLPSNDWMVSFHDQETGELLSSIDGSTIVGAGGNLFDQQLVYIPDADDLGKGIQIRLSNITDGAAGGVNFDRVNLTVIPEPASFALFGLALFATARRRKA